MHHLGEFAESHDFDCRNNCCKCSATSRLEYRIRFTRDHAKQKQDGSRRDVMTTLVKTMPRDISTHVIRDQKV